MALIVATQIVSVLFKCCELRKMTRRRLYLVELFAGCHSVSRCVRRCFGKNLDVRILSVDNDPASNPTILVNINRWQYKPDIDEFLGNRRAKDIVTCWTSPPCKAFSRANSTGVRDITGGILNVKSGLRIVRYCKPNFWFQENPVGLLKDQPFMGRFNKFIHTCCYCKYGRPYKKPTNIWSNVPKLELKICEKLTPCTSKRLHGRHLATAQSGPSADRSVDRSAPGSGGARQVYPIPKRLVYYLFRKGLLACGNGLRRP